MDAQDILNWLVGEAGAGWIFGIVSTVLLIRTELRRRRPQIIYFEERANTSLLSYDPVLRDQTEISFGETRVAALSLVEGCIYNSGTDVAREITVWMRFPSETRVLQAFLSGNSREQEIQVAIEDSSARLDIPYLNPEREHGHRLCVALFVDGKSTVEFAGSGPGWSVRKSEAYSRRFFPLAEFMAIGGGVAVALLAATYYYVRLLADALDLQDALPSAIWRAPLVLIPIGILAWLALLVGVAVIVLQDRRLSAHGRQSES